MKNKCFKVYGSFFSAFLFSCLASPAFAQGLPVPMDLCLEPYIGVTGQGRHITFVSGFGDKLFKKDYPELDVYLGVKFNDYFGIEGGYKVSTTETQVASLGGDDTAVGIPVLDPPAVHRGTSSFKGWHGDLVGYLPIMQPNCVYLLGSIGFSRIQVFARDKLVQNNFRGSTAFLENQFVRTFTKTQTILTLGTGLQVRLDEKSSIRVKIGWENTGTIKSVLPQESINGLLKLGDSFTYGIGIVINFL